MSQLSKGVAIFVVYLVVILAPGVAFSLTVTSVEPADGETGVSTHVDCYVYFSQELEPSTISSNTVFIADPGGNPVARHILDYGPSAVRIHRAPC